MPERKIGQITQIRPIRIPLRLPQEKGLVLYLPFDRIGEKKAFDLSPYRNDGTIYGAVWVPGKIGGALSFDGVDDYVNCGSDKSLELSSAFTLAGWFKFEPRIAGGKGFVQKGVSTFEYDYMFYLSTSGHASLYFKNPGGTFFYSVYIVDIRDGLFHHWTGTFDGRYLKLYIDSQLKETKDTGGTKVRTTTSNLTIGFGYGNYAKMLADEVRIYNRALSAEEIKDLYYSTHRKFHQITR